MAVSPGYKAFVLEQLAVVGTVTSRPMFGGVGLYHEGVFFGLLDDDTTFLKVDDENRPDYEALGMEPFRPPGEVSKNYYQLPAEVLEERETLRVWVERAVTAARRKSARKKKRPPP